MSDHEKNSRSAGPWLYVAGFIVIALLVAIELWPKLRMYANYGTGGVTDHRMEAAYSPDADKFYRAARANLAAHLLSQGFNQVDPASSRASNAYYPDDKSKTAFSRKEPDGSISVVSILSTSSAIYDGKRGVGCVWSADNEVFYWRWEPGQPYFDNVKLRAGQLGDELRAWWKSYIDTHPLDFPRR